MIDHGSEGEEVPLLAIYPHFQRLILGGFRKKQYLHTKSQIMIMMALSSHKELTMSQIAQYISSSNEQATRAVAPLVGEGYLERYTDSLNRTYVLVRLTEQGREYVSHLWAELGEDLSGRVKKSLSAQEQQELNDAVCTLKRLLSKIE